MTPETLQRMREAAEDSKSNQGWYEQGDMSLTLRHMYGDYGSPSADAAHIALASPENVLALLDEVERWRGLFGEETHS